MFRSATIGLLGFLVAQASTVRLMAALTSAGGPESEGAYGTAGLATVTLNPDEGQVCYDITAPALANVTAIHIHQGAAGQTGPIVVPLPISPGSMKGCTSAARETVRAIAGDPSGYYVNVHTHRHPQGAIRGQLVVAGG